MLFDFAVLGALLPFLIYSWLLSSHRDFAGNEGS